MLNWPNYDYRARNFYEQILKPIIYLDYDFNTFQTAKSTTAINAEMDTWFFTNFKGTDLYSTWEAGVAYLTKNLDSRYFDYYQGQISTIKQYQSPMYYIGDSTIPKPGRAFQVSKQDVINDQQTYVHCIRGKLSIY